MNSLPLTLSFILASVVLNASAQILLRLGARSGLAFGEKKSVMNFRNPLGDGKTQTRPARALGL